MTQVGKHLLGLAIATSVGIAGMTLPFSTASAEEEGSKSLVEEGLKLATTRKKGNCIACHLFEGGDMAGTIGPPLVGMKARFPDKEKLRAQIWDPTVANPETIMSPFGRHKILSEKEIDAVVEFVLSL